MVTFTFPGFTKKALTFSIDDGNLETDKIWLDIVRPAGIKGTFNLCSAAFTDDQGEMLREFYKGYEIANHLHHHVNAMLDGAKYDISSEPFCEETADTGKLYRTEIDGMYRISTPRGWRLIADTETYCKFEREGKERLEKIFGTEVKGFVWPFSRQKNNAIIEYLQTRPYQSIRNSACTGDSEGFDMPTDRSNWNIQAHHGTLLELFESYLSLPDDGKLKFFCFGMHSVDYERAGKWDDLRAFAQKAGHRDDLYYATVGEIFDYEDAVKAAGVNENTVKNNSPLPLYAVINGQNTVIFPGECVRI